MDRARLAGRALRAAPTPPAGGLLPDARLAQRGRRRRARGVAALKQRRHQPGGRSRRVADDRRRSDLPQRAALPCGATRGAVRPAHARPDRLPGRRRRPRGRGAHRRLGRPGPVDRPRHTRSRRTAGVRSARRVRCAVRADRRDHRSLRACRATARQPRSPPSENDTHPRYDVAEQWELVDAFLAAARDGDFDALLRCSTRTL